MAYLDGVHLPATALDIDEAEWLAVRAALLPQDAVIVHLGVSAGASLVCSRVGNPTARIVGVDHDVRCAGLDIDADIILADSRTVAWKRPPDFLFVDADHTEGSVIADIQNWHGRIVAGGIIAFHDYGNTHFRWCKGVKAAVDGWDWDGWTEIGAPGSIKAYRKDST